MISIIMTFQSHYAQKEVLVLGDLKYQVSCPPTLFTDTLIPSITAI